MCLEQKFDMAENELPLLLARVFVVEWPPDEMMREGYG